MRGSKRVSLCDGEGVAQVPAPGRDGQGQLQHVRRGARRAGRRRLPRAARRRAARVRLGARPAHRQRGTRTQARTHARSHRTELATLCACTYNYTAFCYALPQ